MQLLDRLSRLVRRWTDPTGGRHAIVASPDLAARPTITVTHDRRLASTLAQRLEGVADPIWRCSNGWTARMKIVNGDAALVLVDFRLPKPELERVITAREESADAAGTLLIGLVPRGVPEALAEADAAEVDEYVTLPVDAASLVSRISRLERRRERDATNAVALAAHESELARLRLAVGATDDAIWEWDPATDRVAVSATWFDWLDTAAAGPLGLERWLEGIHPDDESAVRETLTESATDGHGPFVQRFRLAGQNGPGTWVLMRGFAAPAATEGSVRLVARHSRLDGDPEVVGARDVALAELPDRGLLATRLRQAFNRARHDPERSFALLFFDVDRFKNVNDSLGHRMGDLLLCRVAARVREACRPIDTVVRFGGDEFVAIVDELPDVRAAAAAAARIQQALRTPFDLEGTEVFATVSIGIAFWKESYQSPDEMLRDADTAMYRAKADGRNRFAVFDVAMHERVVATLQLENDLQRALTRQEFVPFYQPIVTLSEGRIVAFEALARWNHPDRGLLLPVDFVPVAEEMGTIIQIDRTVAEQACRQLRTWQSQFRRTPRLEVAINVSSTQFMQADLTSHIDLILRNSGIYGASLNIEVTESVLMENAAHAEEMLAQLRSLDIGISIDDFGTGYSSLAYLRRFGIDTLKIDHSFVSRMLEDEDSSEIVRAICHLARNLGKQTVAEGVETRSQLEALREIGVDKVQGNFISPPISAERVAAMLRQTADVDDDMSKILSDRMHGTTS